MTGLLKPSLFRKPSEERIRGPITRGLSIPTGAVKPGSGKFGAGLIQGLAIVTRGEALGHGYWLDSEFVSQTEAQLVSESSAGKKGLKSRFTHPDASSDGMGKQLGRVRYGKRDGDILRGNLHFLQTAHQTPDGDLAGYVMQLAAEDPQMFGTSIVFLHDTEQEWAFALANGAVEKQDAWGPYLDFTDFRSPDPDNVSNFPHARLAKLYAVDVVDDPAANPGGLFHRDPVLAEVESAASYAFGLTQQAPALQALSLDPKRVQRFVAKFLASHNLEIVAKKEEGNSMSDAAPAVPPAKTDQHSNETQTDLRAELKRFREKFGAAGVTWFEEGKTWEQAEMLHAAQQAGRESIEPELQQLRDENTRLQAKLQAVSQQSSAVSGTAAADASDSQAAGPVPLKSLIRIQRGKN